MLAELLNELAKLLGAFLFLNFSLSLRPAAFRILSETLLEYFGGVTSMRFGDLFPLCPVKIKTVSRLFHALEVARGVGVQPQGDAHRLAVYVRFPGLQLFVDADCQRLAVTEDRVLFLKGFDESASDLDRIFSRSLGVHVR